MTQVQGDFTRLLGAAWRGDEYVLGEMLGYPDDSVVGTVARETVVDTVRIEQGTPVVPGLARPHRVAEGRTYRAKRGGTGKVAPHVVDTRSRAERRANRKRYKKAKQYFGKTYTLTRAQAFWLVVIYFGTIIMMSSLLTQAWIYMVESMELVK